MWRFFFFFFFFNYKKINRGPFFSLKEKQTLKWMIGMSMLEISWLLLIIPCNSLHSFLLFFFYYKIEDRGSVFSLKQKKTPKSMIGVGFCKKTLFMFLVVRANALFIWKRWPWYWGMFSFLLVCATLSTSKSTTLLRLKKQERLCKATSKASTNLWTSPWFYCISFLTLPADSSLIYPTGSQNTLLW